MAPNGIGGGGPLNWKFGGIGMPFGGGNGRPPGGGKGRPFGGRGGIPAAPGNGGMGIPRPPGAVDGISWLKENL